MSRAMDEQTGRERHDLTKSSCITTSWCGDCRRAKKVFAALGVPYAEINIDCRP